MIRGPAGATGPSGGIGGICGAASRLGYSSSAFPLRPNRGPSGPSVSESISEHIAIRFVNEINRHDVAALVSLMAPDIRFIDEKGCELRGRDRISEAWTVYFRSFPDYRIAIRTHLATGQMVALFGVASGTVSIPSDGTRRWASPAAWRAVISDGRISEWQVYGGQESTEKTPTRPEPLATQRSA